MRNLELRIQTKTILISLFIILSVWIILDIGLTNKVAAASCQQCMSQNLQVKKSEGNSTQHYIYCADCMIINTWVNHSWEWKHDSNNHWSECQECGYVLDNTGSHSWEWKWDNSNNHWQECSECGQKKSENQGKHHGATHENGGKCKDCLVQYEKHTTTGEIALGKCINIGTKQHKSYYSCAFEGCTGTYEGGFDSCFGATHGNDGKCTACLVEYETHDLINEWQYSDLEDGKNHRKSLKCTFGCAEGFSADNEAHYGGTHANGGKCTACLAQYQTHSTSFSHWNKNETTHTATYSCSTCGTFVGSSEEHSGGTHENEGKCIKCGYQYEKHEQSTETTGEYITTETTHVAEYKCSVSDCTETFKGTEENHTGATHENGGKCTVCEYVYQTHGKSTTASSYTKTETQHTAEYKCTYSGCTETYNGTAENHDGATHENGGKCTVCEYVYQTHGKSTTIKEYKKTETGHTPVYACTHENCQASYDGELQNHTVETWADNENGTHSGNCTECDYKITQEHTYENKKCKECNALEPTQECEHSYMKKSDDTNHWEECSKCNTVKQGSLETHKYETYTDNRDGTHSGNCTECEYKIIQEHTYENKKCKECNALELTQECEHSYVKKSDDTNHWEECSKCNTVKQGSLRTHKYDIYTDNRDGTHSGNCTECDYKITQEHTYENKKCKECNALEPTQECEHSYVKKSDDTNHWKECSKCNIVKQGSLEKHKYEEYTDNRDGTHSAICSECEYKLTEQHNYENKKCTKCIAIELSDDNNNNDDNNNDKNNNNSNKDDTMTDKEIPKAGAQSKAVMLIIVLGAALGISILKMKKYKDI